MRRTAVRFLGGDYRRALPEFDALAGHLFPHLQTHQQKRGVLLSRPGRALRAERGQVTVAQVKFEAVLRQVKAMDSDARDEAVELRRTIGFLELSQERLDEAQRILEPLHDDMCVVYGTDDEDMVEIAEALARIRLTLNGAHRGTPET
ncbi:hypothetical protein ACFWD7_52700 [Streptomyces mirabilis]|uniref:hypothetical protein n=1 Tax=Streptomyces mirabilis TaxID=68239 RepID=UPI0036C019BB